MNIHHCVRIFRVFLQLVFSLILLFSGGYFHGINNLTYGVDLDIIRWMGVLQVRKFRAIFSSFLNEVTRMTVPFFLFILDYGKEDL